MSHRHPTIPNLSLRIVDAGRLQLLNVLGAGAYGTVYRARDRTVLSGKPVFYAVKVQPVACRKSYHGILQTREITFHNAASSHPNVVTMHRVVQDDKYLYIITDFCAGGDMFNVVARTFGFARNDELIRSMFIQLIDGVYACHQKGVFHRDLKPENILLNKERNQLYVADFGLATSKARSDSFGAGSSYYMSPECMNTRKSTTPFNTRASDVWSLGIILINMITGRNPWGRAAVDDECYASYLEYPGFLRTVLPISRSANRVLRRILTDDPAERIDLPSLRRLIEEVDTFSMSDEDVAASSEHMQNAWNVYYPREKIVPLPVAVPLDWDSWMDSDSSFYSSDDPKSALPSESSSSKSAAVAFHDAKSNFALDDSSFADALSTRSDDFAPRGPLAVRNKTPTRDSSGSSSYVSFLETHSSDEEDSEGPETPETYAQDSAAVAVPEISQSVDLGDAFYPPADLKGKRAQSGAGLQMMQRVVDNQLVV